MARNVKCLADILNDEDAKDIQELYTQAEQDNFLLCRRLSAELKKLQQFMKATDSKQLKSVPVLVAAAE